MREREKKEKKMPPKRERERFSVKRAVSVSMFLVASKTYQIIKDSMIVIEF